jgi:cbb3-type cytochrome oxidase subunit 3
MKERMKWIVIGFGFMVGIQVLTSLMFSLLLQITNQRPGTVESDQWVLVIFGLTLGAFLIGGLVIGRVAEQSRIYDALWAAILTLIFSNVMFYVLPEGTRHQFTGSKWLLAANGQLAPLWLSVLQMLPALGAAGLGALLGAHMTTPVEAAWERFIGMLGLVGAIASVTVVFVIGSIVIPWYWLALLLVLFIGGCAYTYREFKRGAHEIDEVSILPEHRHEQPS